MRGRTSPGCSSSGPRDSRRPFKCRIALSRNVPKLEQKLEILWGNCNAHARRRFVQVTPNFPQECQFVLESLREVYRRLRQSTYSVARPRNGVNPVRNAVGRLLASPPADCQRYWTVSVSVVLWVRLAVPDVAVAVTVNV